MRDAQEDVASYWEAHVLDVNAVEVISETEDEVLVRLANGRCVWIERSKIVDEDQMLIDDYDGTLGEVA